MIVLLAPAEADAAGGAGGGAISDFSESSEAVPRQPAVAINNPAVIIQQVKGVFRMVASLQLYRSESVMPTGPQ